MKLPDALVNAFVNATNDKARTVSSDKIYHATVTTVTDDSILVTIDGSDVETPVVKTCEATTGDRVMVELKNRKAYLVGNMSHPVTRVTGDDIISVVEQEYGEINLALYTKKDEVIAAINLSTETSGGGVATINASKINLNGAVSLNSNVTIGVDGKLTCKNASISGAITSSTYSNGKCNIDANGNVTITSQTINDMSSFKAALANGTQYTSIFPNGLQTAISTTTGSGQTDINPGYIAVGTRAANGMADGTTIGTSEITTGAIYLDAINEKTSGITLQNNVTAASNLTVNGDLYCHDISGDTSTVGWPVVCTASAGQKIYRMRHGSGAGQIQFRGDGGSGNTLQWTTVTGSDSDIRLKKNVGPSKVDALGLIKRIPLHSFDWKSNDEHWDIGFIANEMMDLDPTLVMHSGDEEDQLSINTFYLLGYLTKAIQQLSETVDQQQKRIAFLEDLAGYEYVGTKKGDI